MDDERESVSCASGGDENQSPMAVADDLISDVGSYEDFKMCMAKRPSTPRDTTTVMRDSTTVSFELIPKRGAARRNPFFEFLRDFREHHHSLTPRDFVSSACYVWRKLPAFRKLIYKNIHVDDSKKVESPFSDLGSPPPCPDGSLASEVDEGEVGRSGDDDQAVDEDGQPLDSFRNRYPSRDESPLAKLCGSCTPSFCDPVDQLSGMCQLNTPFRPTCSRRKCRRPRKRHCITDLQPKRRKRRNPRQPRGLQKKNKKKPPWMEDYHVSPNIWQFLKSARERNPEQCLDDFLCTCATQYDPAAVVAASTKSVGCCDSDSTNGSFRSAASYARSLSSNVGCVGPTIVSCESIRSADLQCGGSTCGGCETCKKPANVPNCNDNATFDVRETVLDCSRRSGSRASQCTVMAGGSKTCCPQSTMIKIPCKEDPAFDHFMKIYQIQNPCLSMSQVIKGAECAWSKLPMRYKKLYGPRVYTPTHLSPSPPPGPRMPCALAESREDMAGGGGSGMGGITAGLCNTALGTGSLLGVLTKKLLTTCRDQLMSPEHQAMLNDLVGTEVTVKICNVKKFR